MRGEIIGVWSEAWREIWVPLFDRDEVPQDIFCELYRELARALKEPSVTSALDLIISDAILLREAFDRALVIAGTEIDLARLNQVFDSTVVTGISTPTQSRDILEAAMAVFINNPVTRADALRQALTELSSNPQKRAEAFERAVENIVNDKVRSRESFEKTQAANFAGERALVNFLEAVHGIAEDVGGDSLANLYFNLLENFIQKFSLRYDLRRPCMLCPTLPGVFASLVRDLHALTSQDPHLDMLMKEFEDALRDLHSDCAEGRIKICIQKQVNLLEAIGRQYPGVTGTTLGAICNDVETWPHEKVKEAIKSLYGFASDYPGIRHGGTPANALRAIEMRDMVAISILLAGFTPYLSDQLNADIVYRGS